MGKPVMNFILYEINPYIYKARYEYMFYYGWDCASGCVWNIDSVKEISLIDKQKDR